MSFWDDLGKVAATAGGFMVGGPIGAVAANTAVNGGNVPGGGDVGGAIVGNGTNPGILGTGQYKVPGYNISPGAYQNPVGNQADNWNHSQQGLLTSSHNAAPQAQNTALGPASMSGGPDLGQYNQVYGQQQALANQYGQMAAGNGPSLANVQAQQQGAQNMSAALAMAGAAGGSSNPALAQYNIGQQRMQIQNQTNQNAVAGRTTEEMGALNAQAGIYGQLQSGALNASGMGLQNNQFNAGQQNQFGLQQGQMNQQTSMANLASRGQQNQLNAQQQDLYNQNLQQQVMAQYAAQQGQQQLGVTQQLGAAGIQAGAYNNSAQAQSGWTSKLLSSL